MHDTILSRAIDLDETTDSDGWKKIQLSSKVNLYLKRGSYWGSWGGKTWRQEKLANKPIDLDTTNFYVGGAGGLATDHAINVCGFVDFSSGAVEIQTQNIYDGHVSTTIYWWAFIVEIVNQLPG